MEANYQEGATCSVCGAIEGDYSEKTGKNYDCIVVLDDIGGKYINVKMEFEKKRHGSILLIQD